MKRMCQSQSQLRPKVRESICNCLQSFLVVSEGPVVAKSTLVLDVKPWDTETGEPYNCIVRIESLVIHALFRHEGSGAASQGHHCRWSAVGSL